MKEWCKYNWKINGFKHISSVTWFHWWLDKHLTFFRGWQSWWHFLQLCQSVESNLPEKFDNYLLNSTEKVHKLTALCVALLKTRASTKDDLVGLLMYLLILYKWCLDYIPWILVYPYMHRYLWHLVLKYCYNSDFKFT